MAKYDSEDSMRSKDAIGALGAMDSMDSHGFLHATDSTDSCRIACAHESHGTRFSVAVHRGWHKWIITLKGCCGRHIDTNTSGGGGLGSGGVNKKGIHKVAISSKNTGFRSFTFLVVDVILRKYKTPGGRPGTRVHTCKIEPRLVSRGFSDFV